jgi:hypothetical protein
MRTVVAMPEPERRPIAGLGLWASPEPITRTQHSAASWLGSHAVRPAWLWRRDLLVAAAVLLAGAVPWLVRGATGWGAVPSATAGMGAAAAVVFALIRAAGVRRWLRLGRIRRRWDAACRWSELQNQSARIPRVTRIEPCAAGDRLTVRLPHGTAPEDLERGAERLAVVLDAREVAVKRNPARMRTPVVLVRRVDPFSDGSGLPVLLRSPLVDAPRWDLWEGVPCGRDEMGQPAHLPLLGRSLLIGGEPEAGKSAALSLVLAAAALDPNVRISGLDAKMVELAAWSPVLSVSVTTDIDDAISLLDDERTEMDARYEKMLAEGIRKIPRDAGWDIRILAVDELRFFTAHPDKKARERFNASLLDLVARGRAALMPVVAATQRPSADVVPTSIRDLMALRWAMRCSTRDASDTILGSGWATAGYSAADIPMEQRGMGLLLAEGGLPVRVKSAWLSDDDIARVVARACQVRGGVQ